LPSLAKAPPESSVEVAGVPVPIGARMKYLDLTLDSKLIFRTHFEELVPRVGKAADSLSRLLPNLESPSGRVRRLYAGIVSSIALYAASVWTIKVATSRRIQALLHGVQCRVTIKMIRAYRMTFHVGTTILAGFSLLELNVSGDAQKREGAPAGVPRLGGPPPPGPSNS